MEFPDPNYREICSKVTLQSSKEGFFSSFASTVTEKVGLSWINNVFAKQKLECDKIRICYEDKMVWSVIRQILQNIKPLFREKSAAVSRSSRLDGDKSFADKNYKKAVMLYSQSIIRAPTTSTDNTSDRELSLPLAYKCRAHALYQLRLYKECITDLNQAIKEGIPTQVRYEIYKLMGMCYKELMEIKRAKVSLEVASKMVEDQIKKLQKNTVKPQAGDEQKKVITVLNKEREELKKLIASLQNYDYPEDLIKLPPKLFTHRGSLPMVDGSLNTSKQKVSNFLTIKQTTDAGRFAVAAKFIKTGTTLVVEEPYASCLTWKMFSSHCHNCYSRVVAAIPCQTCSGLAFCSVKCRDEAVSTYHKYECPFMGLFIGAGMSVLSLLSLRMITQDKLSFFKELYSKIKILEDHVDTKEKTVAFTEKETKYLSIYNLVTHSAMRMSSDYFHRTLMAIFLVMCLKKTEYFGDQAYSDNEGLSEDEILTASLLLRHLQLLQFNAYEIYETVVEELGKTRGSKSVFTAVGIYPTAAMFNHECSPSVTRYFHGKNIVINAVRPITKGEMISENYGPIFTKKTLPERVRELTSRYWFRCKCNACTEDWPIMENLSKDYFRIRCSTQKCTGLLCYLQSENKINIESVCPKCFRKMDVLTTIKRAQQIEKLFYRGLEHMDNRRCDKALPLLTAYLDEIFSLGAPPMRDISLCQEALRTCFAQNGNTWICD